VYRGAEANQMDKTTLSPTPRVETEAGLRPVIAVFNSMDDVIETLRVALEHSGFTG
jgi:hypothetical protein